MARTVVTAGSDFLDIDAYAGIVAYADLLVKHGQTAIATSTAPFNVSVTSSLKRLKVEFSSKYMPKTDDQFVIVDLSDPKFFDSFVDENKVVGVIDHHIGHEAYWQQRIGDKSRIEFVGAACTLVFEQWKQAGYLDSMSMEVATLLAAGIIDNTLNLKAKLTTSRDRQAYSDLVQLAGLGLDWAEQYLADCQHSLMADFLTGLANDTKQINYSGRTDTVKVGQIAVLDSKTVLHTKLKDIETVLDDKSNHWFINILDLKQGSSVFYTPNSDLQTWLAKLLDLSFDNNLATADRLWLRKEIFKRATDEENSTN